MAARWGAGDEILTACNLDFFAADALGETVDLSSGETLDTLQGCLDPSILSIFEDASTGEVKGHDEESEATLLTALTEILDNVDDENLSPFDTLPDSDLLSNQKAREHSPLRRLLCLSRSPPEKDTICNTRHFSSAKNLPRTQPGSIQRSDGEEEEDGSLTLSPIRQASFPDKELLEWESLTLPIPFAFDAEGGDTNEVSVSLGNLVRHMHPYCMAVCVEDGGEEQILPEGGILLEVVDQGEHGEPILAIPDLNLSLSLPILQDFSDMEQKVPGESEGDSENSEDIIVDDDTTFSDTQMKVARTVAPVLSSEMNCEVTKRPQTLGAKAVKERSSSCKKKKNKKLIQPEPVEERVLRSSIAREASQEPPQKPVKRSKKEKKKREPVPPASTQAPSSPKRIKRHDACRSETHIEVTKLTLPPETNVKVTAYATSNQFILNESPDLRQPYCPHSGVDTLQPSQTQHLAPSPEKLEALSTATAAAFPSSHVIPLTTDGCSAPVNLITPVTTQPLGVAPPPTDPKVTEAVPELKPKSLSLAEYRRLRQQKKPAPIEKQEDQSTKWPSLPELPKELPPIPCLPNPSPKDPRRPTLLSRKKDVEEVKPAWQPMGPGAPPTPEALLVLPSFMVVSSTKVSNTIPKPKLQQELVAQLDCPSKSPHPQQSSATSPNPVKNLPPPQHVASHRERPCVPQSSGVAIKSTGYQAMPEKQSSSTPSGDKFGARERPNAHPVSPQALLSKKVPSTATTEYPKASTIVVPAHIPTCVIQKASSPKVPESLAITSVYEPVVSGGKSAKPISFTGQLCSSTAVQMPHPSQCLMPRHRILVAQGRPTVAPDTQRAKMSSQELIEAFTTEIGIEAADLTSLLEQFEETQAKGEQCVPEVSGRAAAVGNSSVELAPEKTAVERVRAYDFCSVAALTPPATPPHQMWKPLAPVALFGKSKVTEASKSTPSKVIQIEARPLPSIKVPSKPTIGVATCHPDLVFSDHDYCLPNKMASTGEPGKRWNVKQQTAITIKTISQLNTTTTQPPQTVPASSSQISTAAVRVKTQESPLNETLAHRADREVKSSNLETPDASPARQETNAAPQEKSPRQGKSVRPYRHHAATRSPSPRACPRERKRGRSRKRASRRSSSPTSRSSESYSSSSTSGSRSRSPPTKRYRSHPSQSRSSSSSRSSSCSSLSVSRSPPRRRKYSYSSSRSGSWSPSRSPSRSPQRQAQWSRNLYSPSYRPESRHSSIEDTEEVKRRKEKAIEERRVVYIGRIRGTMTRKELRERFSLYGEMEDCTLHFRDHGDNYGFVTYYNTKDAFTAIENGSKLRKPDELPFDLCFGGRRQFCRTSYSDLDSNKEYDSSPAKPKFHALDFDTLLKQARNNMKR